MSYSFGQRVVIKDNHPSLKFRGQTATIREIHPPPTTVGMNYTLYTLNLDLISLTHDGQYIVKEGYIKGIPKKHHMIMDRD